MAHHFWFTMPGLPEGNLLAPSLINTLDDVQRIENKARLQITIKLRWNELNFILDTQATQHIHKTPAYNSNTKTCQTEIKLMPLMRQGETP